MVANRLPGLGVMGYPMAVNLRSKMKAEDTLLICDVSQDAISRFQKQMDGSGPIEVVKSGHDAVKAAVSTSYDHAAQY